MAARHTRHPIQRARERYGLVFGESDLRIIILSIRTRSRRARFIVASATTPREMWLVRHYGRWLVTVYDHRWCRLVTFLPLGAQFTHDGRSIKPGSDLERELDEEVERDRLESRNG